ncbi:hypothetical protein LXL04_012794 [Taraxacum kok-saghyz]
MGLEIEFEFEVEFEMDIPRQIGVGSSVGMIESVVGNNVEMIGSVVGNNGMIEMMAKVCRRVGLVGVGIAFVGMIAFVEDDDLLEQPFGSWIDVATGRRHAPTAPFPSAKGCRSLHAGGKIRTTGRCSPAPNKMSLSKIATENADGSLPSAFKPFIRGRRIGNQECSIVGVNWFSNARNDDTGVPITQKTVLMEKPTDDSSYFIFLEHILCSKDGWD